MEHEQLVKIFKALGNESRLKILQTIKDAQVQCCRCEPGDDGPPLEEDKLYCVDELVQIFNMAQFIISQHLKELYNAGLLRRHKRAQWVYYTVDREKLADLERYISQFAQELASLK
mgnify:CR=1 FL=1